MDQDSVFGRAPGRGQVRPRSIVGRRGEPLAGVEQEHEPFCVDTESALGRRDRRLALIVVGLAPQAVVGRGDDLTGALRPLGRVASRGALLSVLRPRFMVQDQHGRARVPSNPREPPDQGPGLRVVVQVQPEPPRPGLQRVDYDGARPGRLDGLRDLAWVGVRPDVNSDGGVLLGRSDGRAGGGGAVPLNPGGGPEASRLPRGSWGGGDGTFFMTPAWTRAASSKSSSWPVARRAFVIAAWSSRGGVKIDLPFRKRSIAVSM